MRKQIQKLAMGKFEHEEPVLALSTDKIEITVLEGQDAAGDFVISSKNGVKIKGLVYSSNPHMECLTPQFKGEEVRICYQFHSEGFIEGDIQKGEFSIICNQGEYNLSFVVSVSRHYADTSIGKVKSLYDFARLASANWNEAYKIFVSAGFKNLFRAQEVSEQLYYEGFSKSPVSMTNMEEFLVAIHKKECIHFEVEKDSYEFEDVREEQKECLLVRKNNWGYLEIQISSEDAFLQPVKQKITSGDFVGSVCRVEYLIDATKLHSGKNYGRIILENAYQRKEIMVVVRQKRKGAVVGGMLWEIQKSLKELTDWYIEYRLKKIGGAMWAAESIAILNRLLAIEEDNTWYQLMKAQAFLVSRQRQEAEWILAEYRRKAQEKDTPEYGYYLYLCTLYEREPSYVNRLAKEIEDIFDKREDSDILFWILLFVKEEYCDNSTARLRALRQRMADGCSSPFLFMEAYYVYWQNPYLLTRLGSFEIQVLNWAGRRGMLTAEMAVDITGLVGTVRTYQPLFYQVLCVLYEKYEKPELLSAICSYLIRTQRLAPRYHEWYEKGIEEDLRIAGLNEAYLMSMDERNMKKMPRIVQMYFQYNTAIPYKQKAALLVNIIAGRKKEPSVYDSYRKILEEFTVEQILEGHMDDNLSIIYSEILDKGMIEKNMVPALAKILYTHKLTVFGNMAKVYVIHRQLKEIQVVPVVHAVAYFQLYSKDYAILLEDYQGRKYATGISYQLERLMNPGIYLRKCIEYAPYEAAFLLHYFNGREKSSAFMPDDRGYLLQLLRNEKLRDSFRAKLYPEVIRYLEWMDEKGLVKEFIKHAPIKQCSREDRAYLIEQLIECQQYDLAYDNVRECGVGLIDPEELAVLCSYEIEVIEMEEDDFLVNLTSYVFLKGNFNKSVLSYLARYYGGATKNMKRLWDFCRALELDTFELEERLLVQMLYTAEFIDNVEDIYENYCMHDGMELVREAYLSFFSYIYLVRTSLVPNQIFPEIMQRIREDKDVPDVCRIALLQYLTEENEWTKEKQETAFALIDGYVARGMYFAFYQKLPRKIKSDFQFYDKVFLEYRANPKKRIILHYRMEGQEEFTTEEMNDVYEGIFVKAFTIFFGESVEYYITEEEGSISNVVESGRLGSNEMRGHTGQNRFELLNAMLFEKALGEENELCKLMAQYERQEKINEKLFRMI